MHVSLLRELGGLGNNLAIKGELGYTTPRKVT